jgi:tRNA nucleotidyltransferase (CCA-adding enzyme)
LLELLKRADALRRPERFGELLEVARLAGGIDVARLERALKAAAAVNAGEIASTASLPSEIPELIEQARIHAISQSA